MGELPIRRSRTLRADNQLDYVLTLMPSIPLSSFCVQAQDEQGSNQHWVEFVRRPGGQLDEYSLEIGHQCVNNGRLVPFILRLQQHERAGLAEAPSTPSKA